MKGKELKELITTSLRRQGFRIRNHQVLPPKSLSKEKLRGLHSLAVRHKIERSEPHLSRYEPQLLRRLASGSEVIPHLIQPRLVEVEPDSKDELLFRYVGLHWKVPVSSGYGRRLRFLVVDEQNEKLIGLFGLGDPVFSLGARDAWVGWNKQEKIWRLKHVMDAFILGAVPPYSNLLCGKLVAMLVASNEVRDAFRKKYEGHETIINSERLDGRLALITTMSALGKSSVYNRVKYRDRTLYYSAGFSKGSGEFQFSDGLYGAVSEYANRYCKPTAKQQLWGSGFRNRRELIRKCLSKIGLSTGWNYHGVHREVFAIPLGRNTRQFLRGQHSKLRWFEQSANDLFGWFRDRWLLPRASRDPSYLLHEPSSYQLWNRRNS